MNAYKDVVNFLAVTLFASHGLFGDTFVISGQDGVEKSYSGALFDTALAVKEAKTQSAEKSGDDQLQDVLVSRLNQLGNDLAANNPDLLKNNFVQGVSFPGAAAPPEVKSRMGNMILSASLYGYVQKGGKYYLILRAAEGSFMQPIVVSTEPPYFCLGSDGLDPAYVMELIQGLEEKFEEGQ